jgi:hypothetical protein
MDDMQNAARWFQLKKFSNNPGKLLPKAINLTKELAIMQGLTGYLEFGMVVKQTADRQAVPEPEESDYQS